MAGATLDNVSVGHQGTFYTVSLQYKLEGTEEILLAPIFEEMEVIKKHIPHKHPRFNLYRLFVTEEDAHKFSEHYNNEKDTSIDATGIQVMDYAVGTINTQELSGLKETLTKAIELSAQARDLTKPYPLLMVTCCYNGEELVERDVIFQNLIPKEELN